jgi:hypothetical protein
MNEFWRALVDFQHREVLVVVLCEPHRRDWAGQEIKQRSSCLRRRGGTADSSGKNYIVLNFCRDWLNNIQTWCGEQSGHCRNAQFRLTTRSAARNSRVASTMSSCCRSRLDTLIGLVGTSSEPPPLGRLTRRPHFDFPLWTRSVDGEVWTPVTIDFIGISGISRPSTLGVHTSYP